MNQDESMKPACWIGRTSGGFHMSYGQKLIHGEGTSQAGWAPIGFAAMSTPRPSQYSTSLVYLILSDTHMFPCPKRRKARHQQKCWNLFGVPSCQRWLFRIIWGSILVSSVFSSQVKLFRNAHMFGPKKTVSPGGKWIYNLPWKDSDRISMAQKGARSQGKKTPLTCHLYWLFNMDPYDGLV